MTLLQAIVRPDKVEVVKDALGRIGVDGLTVTEVRGHGKQKGHAAIYRGREYAVDLVPKMQIEIIVPDRMLNDAVRAVMDAARTGEIGDGRIFVMPITATYRIRTGELTTD